MCSLDKARWIVPNLQYLGVLFGKSNYPEWQPSTNLQRLLYVCVYSYSYDIKGLAFPMNLSTSTVGDFTPTAGKLHDVRQGLYMMSQEGLTASLSYTINSS